MRYWWIIVLVAVAEPCLAQHGGRWIAPTAFTDTAGVRQIGLLSDGRAGLGSDLSVYAHPLMMFVAPTLELQVTWSEQTHSAIATYHRASVPTPLMLLVQTQGELGIVTPEASVGFLLGITNGVRASWEVDQAVITARLGIEIGIGDPDPRTSVDLPILYPRMVALYQGWITEVGVVYERMLGSHFGTTLEATSFLNDQSLFIEITPRLSWHINEHWSIHVDPVITYGTYPYGNDWQLLLLPDLTYRW